MEVSLQTEYETVHSASEVFYLMMDGWSVVEADTPHETWKLKRERLAIDSEVKPDGR